MSDAPLDLIANKDIDESQLISAIKGLGPPTEPHFFWTKIGNSKEYSLTHRRYAIFQLFARHVRPGMTLSSVSLVLKEPNWLADGDLVAIEDLGGYIPVQLTGSNTVFVIHVLHELHLSDCWMVFLSISGHVERDIFLELLRGKEVHQTVKNATILEIGFIPQVGTNTAAKIL